MALSGAERQRRYGERHPERRAEVLQRFYQSHPGYNANWIRTFRLKLRQEVLEHYSGAHPKCDCCGETETLFLTIDHMNGNGRKEKRESRQSGATFYLWLKRNSYPTGYRVLCYNCNCSIGHYGFCPHNGGYC